MSDGDEVPANDMNELDAPGAAAPVRQLRVVVAAEDFEAGKPLETDVLLKAPIELASLAGVPVPSLEMVGALVDLLVSVGPGRG